MKIFYKLLSFIVFTAGMITSGVMSFNNEISESQNALNVCIMILLHINVNSNIDLKETEDKK